MKSPSCVLAFLTILLLVPQPPAVAQDSQEKGSFYTVADYGLDRDPAEDLKATVERAQAEGKRIRVAGWLLSMTGHDSPFATQPLSSDALVFARVDVLSIGVLATAVV